MGYILKVELLSDMIFGTGLSVPGDVDLEIRYDEYGLIYCNGKTIKGLIREKMYETIEYLKLDKDVLTTLLGAEGISDTKSSKLSISDLQLSDDIRSYIQYGIDHNILDKDELIASMTSERSFTSIEGGKTKEGSLRTIRTINSGLVLYSSIEVNFDKLTDLEEGVLAISVARLRNFGSMRSRGKGRVKCSLLKGGRDITKWRIERMKEDMANEKVH